MTEIHIISISIIVSALVTWLCFLYYSLTFKDEKPRNGSQIRPMYFPPPPPERKEPMSFTSDQVNEILKHSKKCKIKPLKTKTHECSLNPKNIKDVKFVRVDENNNILEIYSLNKQKNENDRQTLIKEIEQDLKKVHDVLWDTPFDSKLSERFINAMNKQNSAIIKLLELCKH